MEINYYIQYAKCFTGLTKESKGEHMRVFMSEWLIGLQASAASLILILLLFYIVAAWNKTSTQSAEPSPLVERRAPVFGAIWRWLMQLCSTPNAPVYPSSLSDVLIAVMALPKHFSYKLIRHHDPLNVPNLLQWHNH